LFCRAITIHFISINHLRGILTLSLSRHVTILPGFFVYFDELDIEREAFKTLERPSEGSGGGLVMLQGYLTGVQQSALII